MSVKTIPVSVSDKTNDLTAHLAQYVAALKTAVSDGWQPGTDIPVILQATITQGYAVAQDFPLLSAEFSENRVAFEKAVAVGAVDILSAALA